MRILIAEDDLSVCEMLRIFLKKEKMDAFFVHNGIDAEHQIKKELWDLLILDWMMPGKDGLTLCRETRHTMDTPIILLTAKDGENERIAGLNSGADDYVTKPFSPLELVARIQAVMRRYQYQAAVSAPRESETDGDDIIVHEGMTIHESSREVRIEDRSITNLTPKEFDLLVLFAKNPKKVFTRDQLIERIWGYDYYGEERTIDVHIKRLRGKIAVTGRNWITTVWGVGYKFEESCER